MAVTLNDIVFIINPKSGISKENITQFLNEKGVDFFLSKDLEAFHLFFKEKANQYKVFVICGGDGTINSSLQYFVNNPEFAMAVYPTGSGNGFARELNFKKDLPFLLEKIQAGRQKQIDVMSVNDEFACNMVGLGLDAYVAAEFDRSKSRGLRTYIKSTIKILKEYIPVNVEIDEQNQEQFLSVCIANTRQFGSNAIVAPNAKCDDGLLDIVKVKPFPAYLFPHYVMKMFRGGVKKSEYVKTYRTDSIVIKSNSRYYHIDGEVRKMGEDLQIKIAGKINIIDTK